MHSKGKLIILTFSALVVVYAITGVFYGRVIAKDDAYKELAVFTEALRKVSDDYVEKVDLQKAMEGAMRGLMEALDPYSSYLSRDALERIEKARQTGKADCGLEFTKRGGLIYVIAPIYNGPAYRAGIRPGDYIDSIDDIPVSDLSLPEVQALLRGPENSEVKLSLIRSVNTEPIEVKIQRQVIKYPEVKAELMPSNIGYIKVFHLYPSASQDFRDKLRKLVERGAEKLLLDLRNVAGGEFDEAVAIANAFLRSGVIVHIEGRNGMRETVEAKPYNFISDKPLAVLVNQSTSGPAEIIAGAISDNKRGEIVGEKTFGSGSRQQLVMLRNGAALSISTHRYLTPSGNPIQNESFKLAGIKPSIVYPDDKYKADLLFKAYYSESPDQDASYREVMERIEKEQLQKAIEVLQNIKTGSTGRKSERNCLPPVRLT